MPARNNLFFILLAACMLLSSCSGSGKVLTGSLAPEFNLRLLDGSRFFLNDQKGKVVLLAFWAPWCDRCLEELVYIQELSEQYGEKGLLCAAINIEGNDEAGVMRVADENNLSYPVMSDINNEVKKLYSVNGVPHTFIIDRKGRVRFAHFGFREQDLRSIMEEIEQLL